VTVVADNAQQTTFYTRPSVFNGNLRYALLRSDDKREQKLIGTWIFFFAIKARLPQGKTSRFICFFLQ